MVRPPAEDVASEGGPPSPFEVFRDRRALVDAGLGPIAFVTVNALAGLEPAAAAAVALSVLVLLERVVRRRPVTNAIGGLFGTGLAVFIALRTGTPEGYFVPRMLYAAALAIALTGSVAFRRPVIGFVAQAVFGLKAHWYEDMPVRRAYGEITLAWAALFALRAAIYAIFIALGKVGALAAASVVMGWPAFLALLWLSYRYVPRRIAQLRRAGAPPS